MNLYRAEGIECRDEVEESDSDCEAENYDAVEFLDNYKDHDWQSGWNDNNFDDNKLKVNEFCCILF